MKTDRGNHPIILGPVLVHHTKTFRPFHYLASTMIRLNPRLVQLRAFGTDGEPELIKAFRTCFPHAVHLRCMNHLRQNVKDKLHDLKIPQNVWKNFLSDIFGVQVGNHFECGLVDSPSDTIFSAQLKSLKERWNNLERSYKGSSSSPEFHTWFLTYKSRDFIECALPEVRTKAGIDPFQHFTTNSSESVNHIIKLEVEWKENKLPNLIEHLKNIDRQKSELEKSIVGRGQWHFTEEYNHLIASEASWFSQNLMSNEAKQRHLNKVLTCKPVVNSTSSNTAPSSLSISFEDCGITSIDTATLENMWKKACDLVKSGESILSVPWSSDDKCRLVKSYTSAQPHMVTVNLRNRNMYICDDKCPMFKGYSICAHVVAAAEDNGDLASFLDCVKCKPNLTSIASAGMPSRSGRKGGKPKRKRNRSIVPIETRSVRPCLVQGSSTITGAQSMTMPAENTLSLISQQNYDNQSIKTIFKCCPPIAHRFSSFYFNRVLL